MWDLGMREAQGSWPNELPNVNVAGLVMDRGGQFNGGSGNLASKLGPSFAGRWDEHLGKALVSAASRGDETTVRSTLAQNINPGAYTLEDGTTPLHLAAAAGSLSCVKLLVDAKASGAAINEHGETPLQLAVKANSGSCCAALLLGMEGAPDVWAEMQQSESLWNDVVVLLLAECGESPSLEKRYLLGALVRMHGSRLTNLRRFLFLCISRNWVGGASAVLQCGASPDSMDPRSHRSALELADALLRHDIARTLRSWNASEDRNAGFVEWALVVAAARGSARCAECWSGRGDPDWREPPPADRCTALMHAAAEGHSNVIEQLMKDHANPALYDKNGLNAAEYARRRGNSKLAIWLDRLAMQIQSNRDLATLRAGSCIGFSSLRGAKRHARRHNDPGPRHSERRQADLWKKRRVEQLVQRGILFEAASDEVERSLWPPEFQPPPGWRDARDEEDRYSEVSDDVDEETAMVGRSGPFDHTKLTLEIISADGQVEKGFDKIDFFVKVRHSKKGVHGLPPLIASTEPKRSTGNTVKWDTEVTVENLADTDQLFLNLWDDQRTDRNILYSTWNTYLLGVENEDMVGRVVISIRRYRTKLRHGHILTIRQRVNTDEVYQECGDMWLTARLSHPELPKVASFF